MCVKDKYGYINKKGAFVIEPQYEYADRFEEGVAFVRAKDGYAMIDTSGKVVRNVNMPDVMIEGSYSEGLCAVGKYRNEKVQLGPIDYGFMDMAGNLVTDCIYEAVTPYKNGIAEVRLSNGKIGYIDKTGKYVWDPK